MYMTKASLIAIYVILSLPLIILFSIGMFAWYNIPELPKESE